jgi:anti-anti-sigma factor
MLQINLRKLGSVSVLALEGRIVNGEATVLREAVQSHFAIESGIPSTSIVLDFARVTVVDARGLGLLLELRSEALSNGVRLRVINASRLVSRVFEITCLTSVFEVNSALETFPSLSVAPAARPMPLRACA